MDEITESQIEALKPYILIDQTNPIMEMMKRYFVKTLEILLEAGKNVNR